MPSSAAVRASCLIGALPRSGSWLLAEALNNTGLAGQPEEYFRPDFTRIWLRRWGLPARSPYGQYIRGAIKFSTTPNGVFSVKLHWYQFEWFLDQIRFLEGEDDARSDPEVVAKWLPNPRYVLLLRREKARQAISYYLAAQSQVWFVTKDMDHAAAEDERKEDDEPDFQSIRWLEDTLVEHEDRWRGFFSQHEIEPLTIMYEDFVDNYDETVVRVLDWLGVSPPAGFEVTPPGLIKQAGERTELLLAQYLARRDTLLPRPEKTTWSRETRRFVYPELPVP